MKQTLLIVLTTLALGCATVRQPDARVLGLTVTQRSAQGARVEVMVELTNPNATALPLRESAYRIAMGPDRTFAFTQRLDVTLPAGGTQRIVLPAAFADGAAIGPNTAYDVNGSVTYETPGELRRILTDMRVPLPNTPFRAEGRIE